MATNSTYLKVILSAVDKISPAFKKINRISKLTTKSLRDIGRAGAQISKAVTVAGIGALTAAVGGLWKVLGVNREFERFSTILETIEGSSEKARKSMAWVEEFAVKTPYELAGVTDAFVKLKSYGIDPQAGALKSAGDAAAAMGKTLDQSVEALADAMTGENERLKEFGIKAKKQGDRITYAWNVNGKQMTKVANINSAAQIEAVITGIWNSRYAGAMDKLSKTYDGLWANILDVVAKFAKKIGDKGLFSALKNQLQGVLDLLDQWEKDGTLDKIATEISRALTDMVNVISRALREIDWVATIKSIRSTATAIKSVVDSLGGIKNIAIGLGIALLAGPVASLLSIVGVLFRFGTGLVAILGGWSAIGTAIMTVTGWAGRLLGILPMIGKAILFIGRSLMMTPLGIVFSLVTAAVLIYQNWNKIKVWFSDFAKWISTKVRAIANVLKGLMPDWLKNLVTGNSAVQVNVAGQSAANRPNILSANNQKLNGDISVKFENAPAGMRVSEGRSNQSGVKINPDVGYRFNGYAL
ncbi:MAG: tape measure protein [Methylophilaceae bacterium]